MFHDTRSYENLGVAHFQPFGSQEIGGKKISSVRDRPYFTELHQDQQIRCFEDSNGKVKRYRDRIQNSRAFVK